MPTSPSGSSQSSSSSTEPPREIAFDKQLAGRLALIATRNQIRQQNAQLRTQLAQNFEHEQRIDQMLERLDKRLAEHHRAAFEILTEP